MGNGNTTQGQSPPHAAIHPVQAVYAPVPPNFKPWMLTLLIFLAGQTAGAIWWAASINEKVKNVVALEQKFSQVADRVDTALGVLKDHGTEFTLLRQDMARLQGVDDSLRIEMGASAADRFKGKDWDQAKKALDERRAADIRIGELQLKGLENRILKLEADLKAHDNRGALPTHGDKN
jgi:hypothetical protein